MSAHEHVADGSEPDIHELDHHLKDYWKIIITLVVATVIEFGISGLMASQHLGFGMGATILVVIAFFKAILVAKFFMHLKYDPKPLAVLLVIPLVLASPILIICCFDAIKGPSI